MSYQTRTAEDQQASKDEKLQQIQGQCHKLERDNEVLVADLAKANEIISRKMDGELLRVNLFAFESQVSSDATGSKQCLIFFYSRVENIKRKIPPKQRNHQKTREASH